MQPLVTLSDVHPTTCQVGERRVITPNSNFVWLCDHDFMATVSGTVVMTYVVNQLMECIYNRWVTHLCGFFCMFNNYFDKVTHIWFTNFEMLERFYWREIFMMLPYSSCPNNCRALTYLSDMTLSQTLYSKAVLKHKLCCHSRDVWTWTHFSHNRASIH